MTESFWYLFRWIACSNFDFVFLRSLWLSFATENSIFCSIPSEMKWQRWRRRPTKKFVKKSNERVNISNIKSKTNGFFSLVRSLRRAKIILLSFTLFVPVGFVSFSAIRWLSFLSIAAHRLSFLQHFFFLTFSHTDKSSTLPLILLK